VEELEERIKTMPKINIAPFVTPLSVLKKEMTRC